MSSRRSRTLLGQAAAQAVAVIGSVAAIAAPVILFGMVSLASPPQTGLFPNYAFWQIVTMLAIGIIAVITAAVLALRARWITARLAQRFGVVVPTRAVATMLALVGAWLAVSVFLYFGVPSNW